MGGLAGVALRERGPAPGLGSSWARRAAWAGAVRCGRDGADAAWVAEDVEHLLPRAAGAGLPTAAKRRRLRWRRAVLALLPVFSVAIGAVLWIVLPH